MKKIKKLKKNEEEAKKLYKEVMGCSLVDAKEKCPSCFGLDYVYIKNRYGVYCKCGYGVSEKNMMDFIWRASDLAMVKNKVNFPFYHLDSAVVLFVILFFASLHQEILQERPSHYFC